MQNMSYKWIIVFYIIGDMITTFYGIYSGKAIEANTLMSGSVMGKLLIGKTIAIVAFLSSRKYLSISQVNMAKSIFIFYGVFVTVFNITQVIT
jgi:hypothetical protein